MEKNSQLYPQGKSLRYPLDGAKWDRWDPRDGSGRCEEKKHLLLLRGIELQFLGRPVRRLVVIPTELTRLSDLHRSSHKLFLTEIDQVTATQYRFGRTVTLIHVSIRHKIMSAIPLNFSRGRVWGFTLPIFATQLDARKIRQHKSRNWFTSETHLQ
jgi:hypothetical protein